MTGTAHVAGAVAASAFVLPALGFALGPGLREARAAAGRPSARSTTSPSSTYVPKVITIVAGIGEAGKTTVYVRKRNPKIDTEKPDEYNQFIAISTRCMHLGCPVRFVEAAAALHLPVPRRRLRLPRQGRRRPAGAPARPLLHARAQRPASRSARATRSTASSSASRRATRASRSTASASTSTRRAPRSASSRGPEAMPKLPAPPLPPRCKPHARSAPARATAEAERGRTRRPRPGSPSSTGSTSARRCPAPRAG